jgi:hypothetical protein
VNPTVETPITLDRFVGDRFDLLEIGGVRQKVERFAARRFNFGNQRFQPVFTSRRHAHLCAAPGKFERRQPPDAARCTENDGDLSFNRF